MGIVNVSIGATITGYDYFDENGEIVQVSMPIRSASIIPVTDRASLEKSYSTAWTVLFQEFYVIYQVWVTQEEGSFTSIVIQDPLLNQENGFDYGIPAATSGKEPNPFTTDMYLDSKGKLFMENLQNHAYPEDILTIRVPVMMTAIRAQYYVNARILITFSDGIQIYEEGGRTLNTIMLEIPEFYVQLTSSWESGYVYSGNHIWYTITLHNKGTLDIVIDPGKLIQEIPDEVSFVGWGIDGNDDPPAGYTYYNDVGITNDQTLIIKPEEQEESSVSYLVQVK